MLIYLDLCCFNRPFDEQSAKTVYLETEAKLFIQDMIKMNILDLVWSYMLDFENSANPDYDVMFSISRWKKLSKIYISQNSNIIEKSKLLNSQGFGIKDSIHIACSIDAKSDYFITTDKGIIKRSQFVKETKIINPVEFIPIIEGEK